MSIGIPWSLKTWRTSSLAVSDADGSLGRGTKCIVLENLSTIASLVVLPLIDQTCDEIQGNVGHGLVGHHQWSRRACRGTMGRFAVDTDEAGRDKLLGVIVYWRPPKMLRHLPQERTRALENNFFSQVISSASDVQRNRSLVEVSWLIFEATWLLSFMKRW